MNDYSAPVVMAATQMLSELEKAAEKRIMARISPKENILKFDGLVFHIIPYGVNGKADTVCIWKIQMILNSLQVDLTGEFELPHGMDDNIHSKHLAALLYNEVHKEVEKELKTLLQTQIHLVEGQNRKTGVTP